jgi:hypothetical protein
MTEVLARFIRTIGDRLDQAPAKHGLAMLDMLGVRLIPARAARAPIVFTLANSTQDARIPAGTRVAAPPPPGSNDQVMFELEEAVGVAVAKLAKVVSVWPGRDQYIDHTAVATARKPFRPFARPDLEDAPHAIYIAHSTMLALSGTSQINLTFELSTPGSKRLDIVWEFWDGKLWREFSGAQLDCDDPNDGVDTGGHGARRRGGTRPAGGGSAGDGPDPTDGTGGFTRSGSVHLRSDGGTAKPRTVDGVESCWVRGRLDQPLPPDPARILPEIDRVRVTTQIARPLDLRWMPPITTLSSDSGVLIRLMDDAGGPLPGVRVDISGDTASTPARRTDDVGEVTVSAVSATRVASVTIGDSRTEREFAAQGGQLLTFALAPRGLKLDKAVAGELPVDVTKPFLPFGPQPEPGSAFYFSSDEAFSKPGARLPVYVQTASVTPEPASGSVGSGGSAGSTTPPRRNPHAVSWEYWNGDEWKVLNRYAAPAGATEGVPDDFTATGVIANELVVPDDMEPTSVANQEARWMRVRLASGSYSVKQSIELTSGDAFEFSVPRPPVIARMLLGYTWPQGPYSPDRVLAHNDFRYTDRTFESTWPGSSFLPYVTVAGTPALYLGFDEKLPVDRLGVLIDIEAVRGEERGPALQWSYWDGIAWQALVVEDETQHLAQPGIVHLIGQPDSAKVSLFDAELHWIRAALVEDGQPGSRAVRAVYPNAAWASQQLTVVDEPLGASTGNPNQVFAFRQRPVLPGPKVAIRELEGMRANVEWRIVLRGAFPDDPRTVEKLEQLLAAEGAATDLEWRGARLVRDRNKRVREVWLPWAEQPHLAFSGPADRQYVIDLVRGRVLFGDGVRGMVPPLGAAIIARRYRTGGGEAGNLKANTITQLLAPVGGMESVTNPLAAEGGSDGERPEALVVRGPATLHHRGRAISAADYATLALESSAAIGRAWVLPATEPDGVRGAGWVTLVIVPRSAGPQPTPTFGLREEVRRFVAERGPAGLAAGRRLVVTGPAYRQVGVDATLVAVDLSESGEVKQRAVDALMGFLHPLTGGPRGTGWEPGRPVFLSDLATVLEGCRGVDHVREVVLLLDETPQGERADVGDGRVVAAGDLRLRMAEG